jgi:hypothetical protein
MLTNSPHSRSFCWLIFLSRVGSVDWVSSLMTLLLTESYHSWPFCWLILLIANCSVEWFSSLTTVLWRDLITCDRSVDWFSSLVSLLLTESHHSSPFCWVILLTRVHSVDWLLSLPTVLLTESYHARPSCWSVLIIRDRFVDWFSSLCVNGDANEDGGKEEKPQELRSKPGHRFRHLSQDSPDLSVNPSQDLLQIFQWRPKNHSEPRISILPTIQFRQMRRISNWFVMNNIHSKAKLCGIIRQRCFPPGRSAPRGRSPTA